MGMADVASDVRVMRKEQDSHRYDLRLLKASVDSINSMCLNRAVPIA
jgi:hypothetical protein